MNKKTIDPFKGVVKATELREAIKGMIDGDKFSAGYCKGALQYLERKPPNPYIVPLLKKAMEQVK